MIIQGHTANRWQRQDSNPGCLFPWPKLLPLLKLTHSPILQQTLQRSSLGQASTGLILKRYDLPQRPLPPTIRVQSTAPNPGFSLAFWDYHPKRRSFDETKMNTSSPLQKHWGPQTLVLNWALSHTCPGSATESLWAWEGPLIALSLRFLIGKMR